MFTKGNLLNTLKLVYKVSWCRLYPSGKFGDSSKELELQSLPMIIMMREMLTHFCLLQLHYSRRTTNVFTCLLNLELRCF